MKVLCQWKQNSTVWYVCHFSIRVLKYQSFKISTIANEGRILGKLETFGMLEAFNQLLLLFQLKRFVFMVLLYSVFKREETNIDKLQSQPSLTRGCWAVPRLRLSWSRRIQLQGIFSKDPYLLTSRLLQTEGLQDLYAKYAFVYCWYINPDIPCFFLPYFVLSKNRVVREHLTRPLLVYIVGQWQNHQWPNYPSSSVSLEMCPNNFMPPQSILKFAPSKVYSPISIPGLFLPHCTL